KDRVAKQEKALGSRTGGCNVTLKGVGRCSWRYKHEYCIERRSTGASRLQETDVGFTLWGCISHQPPIGKTIGTSRGI
ncbi:unnamed protein product, partial [Ectocarpus fasciculatus]